MSAQQQPLPVILDDLLLFIRAHLEQNDEESGKCANDILTAVQQQQQQQADGTDPSSNNNNNSATRTRGTGTTHRTNNFVGAGGGTNNVDSINSLSLLTQYNLFSFANAASENRTNKSKSKSASRAVSFSQLTPDDSPSRDHQPLSQVLSQIATIQLSQQQQQQTASQEDNSKLNEKNNKKKKANGVEECCSRF